MSDQDIQILESQFPAVSGQAFATARDHVLASVAPLGAEYVAKYQKFLAGKQIDVYESEGKRLSLIHI